MCRSVFSVEDLVNYFHWEKITFYMSRIMNGANDGSEMTEKAVLYWELTYNQMYIQNLSYFKSVNDSKQIVR